MGALLRGRSTEFKVMIALVATIVVLAAILGPVLSIGGQPFPRSMPLDWRQVVTARGDRLPDFSFAGYHSSNKSLPAANSAVQVTLQATSGDQTEQIQQALNQTAAASGGVVLLGEGNFTISSGLVVPRNVTLRGSGPGKTHIVSIQNAPVGPVIMMGDASSGTASELARANIMDSYVPIGTSNLTVDDATGFAAGQSVMVSRAVTTEWVRANGMADLVRDGSEQTWLDPGKLIQQPNTIAAVSGNQINLTIPLTDSLDAAYMSPYISAYTLPSASIAAEVGIEQLSLSLATSCSGSPVNDASCNGAAISFASGTIDSWARDLQLHNFNFFVSVGYNASRITVQDVAMHRDADVTGVALPADISITGSQVLVQDCGQYGLPSARLFSVMTGSLVPGPNAVLRHVTQSSNQTIYPHQRWAFGLLVEDTDVPVLFVNRGTKGSGHGWSMNAGVGWNLRGQAKFESSPLGVNWCIGCNGAAAAAGGLGNGTYKQSDASVSPGSLFQAQLGARGL
ncbi:Pectate lyase superfamily protein [Microdochium nivale]|nr:Pectate lyase superfamily protein [Microdochium nivale]